MNICPNCSAEFNCTIDKCWCFQLAPLVELVDGAECLCPKCLGELITEKAKKRTK
jgi:hypothetical protein